MTIDREAVFQAKDFTEELKRRKKDTTAQVIGRAELSSEATQALLELPPEERILEMLISIDDDQEREELLRAAFEPVQPGGTDESYEDQDQDFLYTTPARLLLVRLSASLLSTFHTHSSTGSHARAPFYASSFPSLATHVMQTG